MFSDFPSLFGRDFAIGYFIPVATALITLVAVFFGVDPESTVWIELDSYLLAEVGIGLLVIWLLSVVLMAINRNIIRIMEGYGSNNPLNWVKWFRERQSRKFNRLLDEESSLIKRYKKLSDKVDNDAAAQKELNAVSERLVNVQLKLSQNFPDQEQFLLPTTFGNRIRSFEVYSRVVYGLDSIGGWERLYAITPEESRESVGQAKAVVDFWVNLHILTLLLAVIFVVAASVDLYRQWYFFLLAGVFIGVVSFAALRSASNAVYEWGSSVKALFDVYRADLAISLGYEIPDNDEDERRMWRDINKVFLFRSTKAFARLNEFRPIELMEDDGSQSSPATYELVHRFKQDKADTKK